MSVVLLSMEGQKARWFHQKYLNLCSKDEQRSYGFGTTWGRVINHRIVIFWWTIPLNKPFIHNNNIIIICGVVLWCVFSLLRLGKHVNSLMWLLSFIKPSHPFTYKETSHLEQCFLTLGLEYRQQYTYFWMFFLTHAFHVMESLLMSRGVESGVFE